MVAPWGIEAIVSSTFVIRTRRGMICSFCECGIAVCADENFISSLSFVSCSLLELLQSRDGAASNCRVIAERDQYDMRVSVGKVRNRLHLCFRAHFRHSEYHGLGKRYLYSCAFVVEIVIIAKSKLEAILGKTTDSPRAT